VAAVVTHLPFPALSAAAAEPTYLKKGRCYDVSSLR
jgi:hypothetical protein